MKAGTGMEGKHKVFTIPNLLTLFRLCLIPLFVWLYLEKGDTVLTAVILVISAVTDMIDGPIARKFNMVSDVGKVMDPVADKLTEIVMLICLMPHFPQLTMLLILMLIKEPISAVVNLTAIHKTKIISDADWHGKLATVALYVMMITHLLYFNTISDVASNVLIGICIVMTVLSLVLYIIRTVKVFQNDKGSH